MITGSQAEFARKYGYSKAAITQFKNAGRLVFVSPGVLDFEASRQRIIDTSDPNRADVARRHAALRNPEVEEDKATVSANSFQNAKTVKEKYLALQAKLDYEVSSGLLVEREQVEKLIFERSRQFRDGLMSLSRRLAPVVIGCETITEAEKLLNTEFRSILESFSKLPLVDK